MNEIALVIHNDPKTGVVGRTSHGSQDVVCPVRSQTQQKDIGSPNTIQRFNRVSEQTGHVGSALVIDYDCLTRVCPRATKLTHPLFRT